MIPLRLHVARRTAIVALLVSLLVTACVERNYTYRIEVRRGTTIEEKVAFARSVATEERLARLKLQIRQQFPQLTDAQLQHLGIRWDVITFKPSTAVATRSMVAITIGGQYAEGFDPKAVVMAAAAILEPEVSPVPASGPVPSR